MSTRPSTFPVPRSRCCCCCCCEVLIEVKRGLAQDFERGRGVPFCQTMLVLARGGGEAVTAGSLDQLSRGEGATFGVPTGVG
jgi:hypothetical protein